MSYTPQPAPPAPLGLWHEVVNPTAEKLRAYFRAGIPVTISGDGLTFRAERRLPADAGEDEDHDT